MPGNHVGPDLAQLGGPGMMGCLSLRVSSLRSVLLWGEKAVVGLELIQGKQLEGYYSSGVTEGRESLLQLLTFLQGICFESPR